MRVNIWEPDYQRFVNLFIPGGLDFFFLAHLEAELVHGVYLVQIVHDEIEQRGPDGDGAIVLPGLVYLHLIDFGFQHLGREAGRV